jgi:hypothetical protein
MMLTNSSINLKIKILKKWLLTVMMKIRIKESTTERKALIMMESSSKYQEECTVHRNLKTKKKIIQAPSSIKSNLSRKTFSKPFFWVITFKN